MTVIDRNIQRGVLLKLSERYPDWLDTRTFSDDERTSALKNIAYLQEHGLVEANWAGKIATSNGSAKVKITAQGLDFLADDGGLSAVLGVVVVKLHEDTLKELLIEQVDAIPQPPEMKAKLKAQISALTAEGVKTIMIEGVKAGIRHIPDLPTLLHITST